MSAPVLYGWPVALPVERRVSANGISLTLFEWRKELRGRGDTILLAHATGFHARCWDQVVRHLGERHVIAVDQRGHGRSDKVVPVHWREFGCDLTDLVRVLDLEQLVGVGHSMGGHAMTEAAAAEGRRFRRLVLIDPVIVSPEMYAAASALADSIGPEHPAARRRNWWASPEEMLERFKNRPPFDAFDRAALRDYCQYGLLPDPAGQGFELACPPQFEAAVYMSSFGNADVHRSVSTVDVPVFLVRVMEPPTPLDLLDFRYSPTWPCLVERFKRGREVHLPDRTHFLPMEDPTLTASYILADE